jgi:uncharacterized protein (TIGR02757 family)
MGAGLKMAFSERLDLKISRIYDRFHRPEYLTIDPLVTVRKFRSTADREFGGFIAAVLSYGRVETIIRNVDELFERMSRQPAKFVFSTDFATKRRRLHGFKHRFNDGDDVALLLQAIAGLVGDHGSMEPFFRSALDKSECGMRGALTLFSDAVRERAAAVRPQVAAAGPGSFTFLVPSPAAGGACKRLNMYLRWMVRPDDGIDMGLWKSIAPAELIIPVDTHISTIARVEKMTQRRTADWRMAEEITGRLRRIDPFDPVRFDFSLCRAGMLDLGIK